MVHHVLIEWNITKLNIIIYQIDLLEMVFHDIIIQILKDYFHAIIKIIYEFFDYYLV